MRATRLFAQLTIYYLLLGAIAYLALNNFPEFRQYLPIGGAEQLINTTGKSSALEAIAQSEHVRSLGQSLGWMITAILGALVAALPVSWVYMATRTSEEYDQSLISSILILPVVVTSIVVVVQHSLSLAFALGGIAGAVRFKNSLKSSGDALYILLTVGIGLSSGIGAVELALVMTLAFNYCFVALWTSEYGERQGMKRYMTDFEPDPAEPPAPPAA
jgi:ABC-type sulfate transport system permease component